jgi:hypothetical protein
VIVRRRPSPERPTPQSLHPPRPTWPSATLRRRSSLASSGYADEARLLRLRGLIPRCPGLDLPNPTERPHMRRLNVRLAIWLLAAIVFTTASVFGVTIYRPAASPRLLAQADRARSRAVRHGGPLPRPLLGWPRMPTSSPASVASSPRTPGRELPRPTTPASSRRSGRTAAVRWTSWIALILQPDRHDSRRLLARIRLEIGDPDRAGTT